MHKWISGLLFLSLLTLASPAWAGSVFLNGVNIDGVTNQHFKNCEVTIDDKGNILIVAKGYVIRRQDDTPGTTPADSVASATRYFLAVFQNHPGATQYDVDLYINKTFVKTLHSYEQPAPIELTNLLQPGKNLVLFVAHKRIDNKRLSTSPDDYFKIVIGTGTANKGHYVIDKTIMTYQLTAADTADKRTEWPLEKQ